MTEDLDLNLQRALHLLEEKIDSPQYLIALWRAAGNLGHLDYPMPEIIKPWWRGLEEQILNR